MKVLLFNLSIYLNVLSKFVHAHVEIVYYFDMYRVLTHSSKNEKLKIRVYIKIKWDETNSPSDTGGCRHCKTTSVTFCGCIICFIPLHLVCKC